MPIEVIPGERPKPVIERAFELARSGEFAKLSDLEKRLYAEGYAQSALQMSSPTLRKQLRDECKKSSAENAAVDPPDD